MWFLIFLKSFVAIPSLLIGLFVLLGCLLEKRGFSKTVTSVIKTIVAFIVIQGGSALITNSMNLFIPVFGDLFGLVGSNLSNEGTFGLLAKEAPNIVSVGAIIMIASMLLNIVLAKFSRFKYVYLSGHILLFMSVALAGVFHMLFLSVNTPLGYAMNVITCSLLLSIYMILAPASVQPWVKAVTKSNELALAHAGTLGYFISGSMGNLIYKIRKGKVLSTEAVKFPKGLSFFRNTTVSISIFMLIFFLAIFIPEGIRYEMGKIPANIADGSANQVWNIMHNGATIFGNTQQNWIITAILQSFTFAAGVFILLTGVNALIGEIVPAFRGISNKLLKNAKAGLDIPMLFPFAPNAVLIGFVSCFVGSLVGMGITIAANVKVNDMSYIILPAIMSVFFQGAGSGVLGNAKGGVYGSVIGGFITGILFTVFPLIYLACGWYPNVDSQATLNALGWASIDFVIGIIPMLFSYIPYKATLGIAIYTTFLLVVIIILIVDGVIKNHKDKTQVKIMTPVPTESIVQANENKPEPVLKQVTTTS